MKTKSFAASLVAGGFITVLCILLLLHPIGLFFAIISGVALGGIISFLSYDPKTVWKGMCLAWKETIDWTRHIGSKIFARWPAVLFIIVYLGICFGTVNFFASNLAIKPVGQFNFIVLEFLALITTLGIILLHLSITEDLLAALFARIAGKKMFEGDREQEKCLSIRIIEITFGVHEESINYKEWLYSAGIFILVGFFIPIIVPLWLIISSVILSLFFIVYIIVYIGKSIVFLCRFTAMFCHRTWIHIHSEARTMALVDGPAGGLFAFLFGYHFAGATILNEPLLEFGVMLLGSVFALAIGYVNYLFIAERVLHLEPKL